MKKITVLALENCNRCKTLLENFSSMDIKHETKYCEKVGAICDSIESLTLCYSYPIVILSEKKPVNKSGYHIYLEEKTILHFAKEYTTVSEKIKLSEEYYGIQVLSLQEMINQTKQFI